MSAEQGDVEALRSWIKQMRERDEWPDTDLALMDVIERVCAALERAELDRDEAIESWQYWRAHGDRELRDRAEKAERALAEYDKALANVRLNEFNGGGDFSPLMRVLAALAEGEINDTL